MKGDHRACSSGIVSPQFNNQKALIPEKTLKRGGAVMEILQFLISLYEGDPATFWALVLVCGAALAALVVLAIDLAKSAVVPDYAEPPKPSKEALGTVGKYEVLGTLVYNRLVDGTEQGDVVLRGFLAGNVETLILLYGGSGFIFYKPQRVLERQGTIRGDDRSANVVYEESSLFESLLVAKRPTWFSWRGEDYTLLEASRSMVMLFGAHPYLNLTDPEKDTAQEVTFWLAVSRAVGTEREAIFVEEPVNDWLSRRAIHKHRVWVGSELGEQDCEEARQIFRKSKVVSQPMPEVVPIRYGQRAF